MAWTARKKHTKFSQFIGRWLNNFGIRLLRDEERKCICILTVWVILRFFQLHQFARFLSKLETHPGPQRFEATACEFYSRACEFCNLPSGRSGVPAWITRAGGRLTDSGDAKVGTAGNIGISESASGNKNCASLLRFDFWVKRTAEVREKCSKLKIKKKIFCFEANYTIVLPHYQSFWKNLKNRFTT